MLLASVLQSTAFSRITIQGGHADLVLLILISWVISDEESSYPIWALIGGFFISLLSAMPITAVIGAYLASVGITWILKRIFWQTPIISLLLSVLLSSIAKFVIEVIALQFSQNIQFSILSGIGNVLFPSLILNYFLLFPIYIIMKDIAGWLSPEKELNA